MAHFIQRLASQFACLTGLLLATAMVSAPAQASEQSSAALSTQELIAAMQDGGLVLLVRHERTEVPSRSDDYSQPTECRVQRNLSLAGVAGAHETGVSLRLLGIEAGRVLTSPMCRAAETARYMFGVDYEHDDSLMHHVPGGDRNLDVAETEVRARLAELAPGLPGSNIAMITHGGTVFRVSGLRLTEGEIAVLRLDDDGTVTTLGQIAGSTLGAYARLALEAAEAN